MSFTSGLHGPRVRLTIPKTFDDFEVISVICFAQNCHSIYIYIYALTIGDPVTWYRVIRVRTILEDCLGELTNCKLRH